MQTAEYSYPELGASIDALRRSIGIRQREVAAECHISLRAYQQVISGKI